jgi:hypothetical protein
MMLTGRARSSIAVIDSTPHDLENHPRFALTWLNRAYGINRSLSHYAGAVIRHPLHPRARLHPLPDALARVRPAPPYR